jgi:hypothetical protein
MPPSLGPDGGNYFVVDNRTLAGSFSTDHWRGLVENRRSANNTPGLESSRSRGSLAIDEG